MSHSPSFQLVSQPSSPSSRPPSRTPREAHSIGFDTPADTRRVIDAYPNPQTLPSANWVQPTIHGKDSDKKTPYVLRNPFLQVSLSRRRLGGIPGSILALIIVWFLYFQFYSREDIVGYGWSRTSSSQVTQDVYVSVGGTTNTTFHSLNPVPVQRPPPPKDSPAYRSQRYLSFLPHSGFHNQRLALENALTLATLLDRTLLLPPVWLGLAIPYIAYDKLVKRIQAVDKAGLEHCRDWSPQMDAEHSALPRECLDYFDFTTLSWDTLIDMSKVQQRAKVVDRGDFSDEWLKNAIGIDIAKDVHWLKDAASYQFRIYSDPNDDDELGKFESRLDVSQLLQPEISEKRLLAIGSLFGTTRMRLLDPASAEVRSHFRESMVFRQPLLEVASDEIKDRLGGEAGYYGLHIRLGDGIFRENAKQNAEDAMLALVVDKMKLPKELFERVMKVHDEREAQALKKSRHSFGRWKHPKLKPRTSVADSSPARHEAKFGKAHTKRGNSQPQKDGAYNHKPLPKLPTIRSLQDLPIRKGMKCRGPFWKEDVMLPFNAPLFIATDSPRPASDPTLSLFFSTFPCTFVLGDFFGAVQELNDLSTLRNSVDQVGLGGFFIPFVDAMVASKGRAVVGTSGSTFSRFTVDILHQIYHGWPILERG